MLVTSKTLSIVLYHKIKILGSMKDSPCTPWKINGWNLQITHEKKGKLCSLNLHYYVQNVHLQGCSLNTYPSKSSKSPNELLVGGWTNPFEKYSSNWIISPGKGEIKNIWNHHLDYLLLAWALTSTKINSTKVVEVVGDDAGNPETEVSKPGYVRCFIDPTRCIMVPDFVNLFPECCSNMFKLMVRGQKLYLWYSERVHLHNQHWLEPPKVQILL